MWMIALFLACGAPAAPSDDDPVAVDDTSPAVVDAPTWHQDVRPIIETRCVSCHQTGGIGLFPLTEYDAVHAVRDAIADAVGSGRMPPWGAAPGCNTYAGDLSMPADEIETILAWAEADGPEGDPTASVPGTPANTQTALSRVDLTLSLPEVYTPQVEPDDYRCFAIPWPYTERVYVTGFRVNPGDPRVVHHVIAYVAGAQYAETIAQVEAEDELPGFACYGGPVVVPQEDAEWLGAWAPGDETGDFPEGLGIRMNPGEYVILQVHYNTEVAGALPDQTTMDLSIAESVERSAWLQPYTNPVWLYGVGMDIPAGESGVTHSFSYPFPGDYLFWAVFGHMHTLGRSLKLTIGDGADANCLLNIPAWDFDWQRTYRLAEPQLIREDEELHLDCVWDNPTDQDVAWGDGTGDEMCLGVLLMTDP